MRWWSWSHWSDSIIGFLTRPTSIFGLKLWVAIVVFTSVAAVVALSILICICIARLRRRRRRRGRFHDFPSSSSSKHRRSAMIRLRGPPTPSSKDVAGETVRHHQHPLSAAPAAAPEVQIEIGKQENRAAINPGGGDVGAGGRHDQPRRPPSIGDMPEASRLGWGNWYTLRELQKATGGFSEENFIGEDGYGVVYRGVLADESIVSVKNLPNDRGQAEEEFRAEVEAIGLVRHKNLVRLLGYCAEGSSRMLVYEYLDNGNLEQWLHGDASDVNPLSWETRMNIILGAAKGLAYLHEGLEPKVVHRDVKACHILLDQRWMPKVSDFGLAKLLGGDRTHVTTRVMGTFGYVAPEYASTGMLNESSDVYSFGVLLMEVITGRSPVDYNRTSGEINLVEWVKTMIGERRVEEIVDAKLLPPPPPSKSLKRALLVALRCVDPEARKRPKMGHVVHMLEQTDDLVFRDVSGD